ncbi:hypothetical protein [Lutibacter sp.]|jgi:hypothetical protein|uniref:hypothetical protein n=1 Tax=Lutibacter sp. TaxID=1925666 RepID=UPI001A183696|nr:hypothetical protein [Lutibacter sp.]MBI9040952.1 hypothetical protein [Lutibacter sp.]
MKNVKLFLVAFAIGTIGLFANNIETPNVSKDEIRKQIVELFDSSELSFEQNSYVNITFTFNTEGEIIVLKVDSMNENILKFIREQLNHKKFDKPGRVNREYTMPINVVTKY